jgi:hypothetical protein
MSYDARSFIEINAFSSVPRVEATLQYHSLARSYRTSTSSSSGPSDDQNSGRGREASHQNKNPVDVYVTKELVSYAHFVSAEIGG